MDCVSKVRNSIARGGLVAPGSRLLAAVSGGPDSMAMLTILHGLCGELGSTLAAAHFDHRIRKESRREGKLVASYCNRLGIRLIPGSGDVPRASRKGGTGIEETAREMRYDFLEKAAGEWGADAVALGHNRDDQVETVLHHIIRGSGFRGLTGMPAKRGIYIRPLLDCGRSELRDFLRSRGIRYAVDPSNSDNRILRNRIRNRLIPYLAREYNPSIGESILRTRENILEGWESLLATTPACASAEEDGAAVTIPISVFESATDFQIYLLIDSVLRDSFDIFQDIEKKHFDAAKELIRRRSSGRRTRFPHGVSLYIEHDNVRIAKTSSEQVPAAGEIVLPGEGIFSLIEWNCSAEIKTVDLGKETKQGSGIHSDKSRDPLSAISEGVSAVLGGISFPLRVRRRKPGDRIVPFGMRGSKKLSDILIDRKIPLHMRESIPVFEDDRGIFWVPGVVAAERTRTGPGTKKAISIYFSAGPRG